MHLLVVEPALSEVLADKEKERQWWAQLEGSATDLSVEYLTNQTDLRDRIAGSDAVAGFISEPALERATDRLQWVHSFAAGPQNQLYPAFLARNIKLTCSKGNGAVPLAEHAMLLMLALARDLPTYLHNQQDTRWVRHLNIELTGKTCAILGAGNSAKELATRARAFGMRVIALKRRSESLPEFDQVFGTEQLQAFLKSADFLVNTLPLTPHTTNLIGAKELACLKSTAYYVCVSRGGIVADDALIAALRNKQIAGAGLDAHTQEPLPNDSPYWTLANTIISPHDAAHCVGTHERGVRILIENMKRLHSDQELLNIVDTEAGY
ncbi:MAG: D-2-hydroxyacid dehydrogenase [Cognatishimia sp.]